MQKRKFYTSTIYSSQRIGPHNKDIISVLVGGLLGDSHAEKRNNATRFTIHASSRNVAYINSLHKLFAENGYCTNGKLKIIKQIGKQNKIYFSVKFRTFSFSSLNFLYDAFYKCTTTQKKQRVIPLNIRELLTEQAFAIWFMDDGDKSGSGLKLSTEILSYTCVVGLQKAIYDNFKILPTIQHHKQAYILYFKEKDKSAVADVVKNFIVDSMLYKFK